MAIRQTTTITSDISGDEEAQTFTYAISGVSYEIDLTDKEIDEFHDAIATFVGHSRKVSGTAAKASTRKASGEKRSDLDAVRAWAKENGHEVAERGRVSKKVLDAFDAAHKG